VTVEGSFGTYLTGLLGGVSAYRAKWDLPDRVLRACGGVVSQSAVARTLAEHVSEVGGSGRSLAGWKTLVWRALGDHGCTAEFLDLVIEVFAIDENPVHEYRLRALHRLQFSTAESRGPLPSDEWVPQEVLLKAGVARRHRTLSVHDSHVVGADGRSIEHRSAQVVQAIAEGCDRYFFNFDAREVSIEVRSGGEVVGAFETEGGLRCNEVAFGREIPVGESHRFEIVARFNDPDSLPLRVRRASADRLRGVSIQVSFHREALPRIVEWAEWNTIGDDEPVWRERVSPADDGIVHRYVASAERSVVGFMWSYSD
jgi:hypothetical protein